MKNGTESRKGKVQLNVRIPSDLRSRLDAEVGRQGRKKDEVISRIVSYFLSFKQAERDEICSKAA